MNRKGWLTSLLSMAAIIVLLAGATLAYDHWRNNGQSGGMSSEADKLPTPNVEQQVKPVNDDAINNIKVTEENWWEKGEKREGVYLVENGVPIRIAGVKEQKKAVAGGPELSRLFWDTTADKRRIAATIEGEELSFVFRTQPTIDEKLLFSIPDIGTYIQVIPNSNYQHLMSYKENLYLVDSETSQITPMLKDKIGIYNLEDHFHETIDDFYPSWGSDAEISPDGKILLFKTTRNALHDGNFNGQVWVKYLPDEEEYFVTDAPFTFIGFGSNDYVFYASEDTVERVHLQTKQAEVMAEFSLNAAISGDYLIYQPERNQLFKLNVENKAEEQVHIDGLGKASHILTYPESPWVLIINQPDPQQAVYSLILYNVQSGEQQQLSIPEYMNFHMSWVNSEQFLISYQIKGTEQEETYIINVADVI